MEMWRTLLSMRLPLMTRMLVGVKVIMPHSPPGTAPIHVDLLKNGFDLLLERGGNDTHTPVHADGGGGGMGGMSGMVVSLTLVRR